MTCKFSHAYSWQVHALGPNKEFCAEGAFGEDEEAKKDFEQLARQEMDVFKSMVTGKAVQEHMEDVYHDMIKVCPVSRPASPLHSLTDVHHAVHRREHCEVQGGSIGPSRRVQGTAYVALHCL